MIVLTFFRLLSPLSAVPLVALAGFGLYEHGFPLVCYCFTWSLFQFYNIFLNTELFCFWQLAKCIEIGLPEIILLLLFSQVNALRKALLVISKEMLTRDSSFWFLFAVHSSSHSRRKTSLPSICCDFLCGYCLDLRASTYRWWSL